MKARFVDARNCHALLPKAHGLSLAQRLDDCLKQINDTNDKFRGSIKGLIDHNGKTRNKSRGSDRYCDSPIEIALVSSVTNCKVNAQVIEGPPTGPAKLHTVFEYENGMIWKTIIPLQFLLKGWGDANRGHQCYIHTISHNVDQLTDSRKVQERGEADDKDYYYVGITGRNWLLRLSEHIGEMDRGSRKRFHSAWRESLGIRNIMFSSSLMDINLSFEDAMTWEEISVDRVAYGPNGLNMIPGGFKGLKYLHEHRIIGRDDISLEERDKAISEFLRQNPRKGIPNPFMAELWKDDDHYLRVMGARSKTLSPDQVRKIRELEQRGYPIETIAEEVGALNEVQVKNVIARRTYTRIR